MNKIALVVGVAAVATLSGCKDPDYLKPHRPQAQDEVKQVEATPEAEQTETVEVVVVEEEPKCTCPAGAVHKTPCKCRAADCKCKVEAPAPVQETTPYIVQRGDTLSGISKRYNIKQQAIRDANPKMKGDKLLLGTTIKLPGKVNVGEQKKPAMAAAPAKKGGEKTTGKSSQATTYTGETTTYTVQEGDTLGKIAYGHGINIRQLKSLNGLSNNNIRVGQKLKVPAAGAVQETAPAPQPAATATVAEPTQLTIAPARPAAEAPVEAPVAEEAAAPAEAAPVPQVATMDYTVQEGDDITGISIQYGVAAAKIRELNGLEEGDQLKVGQVIKLPADNQ